MNPIGAAAKPSDFDRLLNVCDREPIHIPGAIQPQGYLLCLSEPDLCVVQASANLVHLTGRDVADLLGQPLAGIIGDIAFSAVQQAMLEPLSTQTRYVGPLLIHHQHMDALLHRHDDVLILELEPRPANGGLSFTALYPVVRTFVTGLQRTESVQELCKLAVDDVRRITGFGRVLAYRFDEEGHGRVLAESREPDYASYDGLYFPASDIPQQARALYRRNHIRLIADADYQPCALVPPLHPHHGKATDLSFSALRSVSPVHLQYMRNMGTTASMSISIVVRGELWGLISCHHASARPVPFEIRTVCEHLGQVLSMQMEAKEERAENQHGLQLRRLLVSLLASMADRPSFIDGLGSSADELLRFADASGAAIVADDRCLCVGQTPSEEAIKDLGNWLAARGVDGVVNGVLDEVYASDHLQQDYPQAAALQSYAAGLMAASISQIHPNYVIWFRPEVERTVTWAGKPDAGKTSGEGALNPRKSFDAWTQTVRGRSLPWRRSELEAASELRLAILGVVLRRAEELAALADELQRANNELEAFSYSVSHDLRAPLRHIIGYADLLHEMEATKMSERGQRYLRNIDESAHFAGALVDDLLSFSQMGRAALRLGPVDLNAMVQSAIRDLRLDTQNRDLQWEVSDLPEVTADPAFLRLVLRNLLANAVKYTRARTPARIVISGRELDGHHVVNVADNGVGFNMKYVGKLFGVFQRLHRMEDFEGTGIGLANVRRIIERHQGRVWATGEVDQGATFSFSLPISNPNS